jgi:hypothetical protein
MLALAASSRNRHATGMRCRAFDAGPSPAVGHAPSMRIWRHHERESEPVWTAGKPVWSEVHIGAPKAVDLVHHDDDVPHRAA